MTRAHGEPQYRKNQAVLARQARNADMPCARCGAPIDYTASSHLNPLAFTAGHIVSVVSGGTHDLDNLQPEHRVCNIRAGGRTRGRGTSRPAAASPPVHPAPHGW